MATGDGLTAAKAWWAAIAAALAPGAVYIAANAANGITGVEWVTAAAMCIAGGAAAGLTAYNVENKPKPTPPEPELKDPPGGSWVR